MVSAGHVGGTRGSGIVSSAADVLWMSVVREMRGVGGSNDTAYKRWSCYSGLKLLCKLCRTSPPPAMGARFTVFLVMPAMRTQWMAGAAAHKSW